ncbi:hypothetical protein GWI33_020539 [Rhynchophorus ferrugineus]|uniref:Uncharacterized protein n=1 Tax=Rhynchophorus ferrugineus TaxID=354439 RepID=A0A834HPA4_RHYFE|nr:hypothetical protein GWI33_020539 [Rhynchophorus ferrugineus]
MTATLLNISPSSLDRFNLESVQKCQSHGQIRSLSKLIYPKVCPSVSRRVKGTYFGPVRRHLCPLTAYVTSRSGRRAPLTRRRRFFRAVELFTRASESDFVLFFPPDRSGNRRASCGPAGSGEGHHLHRNNEIANEQTATLKKGIEREKMDGGEKNGGLIEPPRMALFGSLDQQ